MLKYLCKTDSARQDDRFEHIRKEAKMENCIFCKIIAGEIPSRKVYEDNVCMAMLDISPASLGHVLVLPKKHVKDLTEMDESLCGHLLMVAKEIGLRQKERLNADGFNVVQNNGEAAGQTVLHFHIHVIPRYKNDNAVPLWTPKNVSPEVMDEICTKLS